MKRMALGRDSQKRWAVFISGTGSNLGALLDLRSEVDIRLVISSSKKALGLLKARRSGVPTLVLDRPINWKQLLEKLNQYSINAIFLAGFMKVVPAEFIKNFSGLILNLHPSLLPEYPGLESIKRAYEDQANMGCTIHHVVPEVDAGPIIRQKKTSRYNSLEDSEFAVHIAEQSLVREVVLRC